MQFSSRSLVLPPSLCHLDKQISLDFILFSVLMENCVNLCIFFYKFLLRTSTILPWAFNFDFFLFIFYLFNVQEWYFCKKSLNVWKKNCITKIFELYWVGWTCWKVEYHIMHLNMFPVSVIVKLCYKI